jgi:hypothetical protein
MANETFLSPVGVFQYPHLHKPRDYKGDQKFKYDVSLVLEGAVAAEFAKTIDAMMDGARKELKKPKGKPPYKPLTTKDGEEIPGKLVFKFQCPAAWPDGQSRRPRVFDANGEPVKGVVPIGGGSTGRIAYTVYVREHQGTAGVTLQPQSVQLRTLSADSGSDPGFGRLDDGEFTKDDAAEFASMPEPSAAPSAPEAGAGKSAGPDEEF